MVDATLWEDGERRELGCGGHSVRWKSSGAQRSAPGHTMSRLAQTIEGEIIPRLLLALQSAPAPIASEGVATSAVSADDVAEFARLAAMHDVSVSSAYVNTLLARGVALEKIYLELLTPAARLLGEWWKDDLRDFTEVTSGLCRMHQLLHEFSATFLQDAQAVSPDRGALLVPVPGEQHSFGLIMVAEFFRRAGWDVWDRHPSTSDDLLQTLRRHHFAVAGVSLSCETRIEELPGLIARMRAASRNPAIVVMVGGQPFIGHPERIAGVGADCTAADGRRAPLEARRFVNMLTRPA